MNLLVFTAFLLAAKTTAQQQQLYDDDHHHQRINPLVSSSQHYDIMISVPPSPECWIGAMRAMHRLERDAASSHHDTNNGEPPVSLGSLVCTNMSHDHKKALALELARCQMEDVGRSLFHETTTDCSRPVKSKEVLHSCLSHMTDAGMHSYALFFTHVHQSCTRLTQEQLMQASQVATEQLHTMLVHHSEMWTKREERDLEFRAQHEEMLQNLWIQAEKRDREMMELTKNVEATAEKMKPLLGIESFVSMATNGITWLTSLAYFLVLMNGVWLLTLSKRHDFARRHMFRIACAEASLEFVVHWMVTQGLLADSERVRGIGVLRSWTLTSECCLYVVGLILSVFRKQKGREQAMNDAVMEMMQLIAVNAEKIQKETPHRGQPRAAESAAPRMQLPVVHGVDDRMNGEPTNDGLLSLPPMYKDVSRPRFNLATDRSLITETSDILGREAMLQKYAVAYQEALRVLSHQASMATLQQHSAVIPAQQNCIQQDFSPNVQIIHEESDSPVTKDPKKRHLEEDGEDEGEGPNKKRARK